MYIMSNHTWVSFWGARWRWISLQGQLPRVPCVLAVPRTVLVVRNAGRSGILGLSGSPRHVQAAVKVCLSQFRSSADVQRNAERHVAVARRAACVGADLVLFPELSLTGYEPTRAQSQALHIGAPCLRPLRIAADTLGITIACGAPLRVGPDVEIGLLIFSPDQAPVSYAKQRLHADEEPFFMPGTRDVQLAVAGHTLAPGICYESLQPSHVKSAAVRGASIYAASVAKPASAMPRAHEHYAAMAQEHELPILLANAIGSNDDFISGGRSAAWRSDGSLLASLDSDEAGELLVEL